MGVIYMDGGGEQKIDGLKGLWWVTLRQSLNRCA